MLNSDFDPYQTLIDLANNQVLITDYQQKITERLNDQAMQIQHLQLAVETLNCVHQTLIDQLAQTNKDTHNG